MTLAPCARLGDRRDIMVEGDGEGGGGGVRKALKQREHGRQDTTPHLKCECDHGDNIWRAVDVVIG